MSKPITPEIALKMAIESIQDLFALRDKLYIVKACYSDIDEQGLETAHYFGAFISLEQADQKAGYVSLNARDLLRIDVIEVWSGGHRFL